VRRFVFALIALAGVSVFAAQFVKDQRTLDLMGNHATYQGSAFTGLSYLFFPGWRLHKVATYWNGHKHGLEIHWYSNGQRWVERQFRAGVPAATEKGWHVNGRVRFLRHYQDGQPHGDSWAWHDNGQVAEHIHFESGQQVSVKSWASFGAIHYNYIFRGNERIGVQGGGYCRNSNANGS
jgi:antitoxin component YwqK of YwqJK toxin-antitoxin module